MSWWWLFIGKSIFFENRIYKNLEKKKMGNFIKWKKMTKEMENNIFIHLNSIYLFLYSN
jgi:hypothetical protein